MSVLWWAFLGGLIAGVGATLFFGWLMEVVVDNALKFFDRRGDREDR